MSEEKKSLEPQNVPPAKEPESENVIIEIMKKLLEINNMKYGIKKKF